MKFFICLTVLVSIVCGSPTLLGSLGSKVPKVDDGLTLGGSNVDSVIGSDSTVGKVDNGLTQGVGNVADSVGNTVQNITSNVGNAINQEIGNLKNNTSVKNVIQDTVDSFKNDIHEAVSDLKSALTKARDVLETLNNHGPVDPIKNVLNTVLDNVAQHVQNKTNKILDKFAAAIIKHSGLNSAITSGVNNCLKETNNDIDATIALRDYSECILQPLEQIQGMVRNIISAVQNTTELALYIASTGQECAKLGDGNFLKGGLCVTELLVSIGDKATHIAIDVTTTISTAAQFCANVKVQFESCLVEQSAAIATYFAAHGVTASKCLISAFTNVL